MKVNLIIKIMLASVIASGCIRRPLTQKTENVMLVIKTETDALEQYPDLTEVFCYDALTGHLEWSGFTGRNGGQLSIPAGNYDIVLCSFGSESVITGYCRFIDSIRIYTNPIEGTLALNYRKMETALGDSARVLKVITEPDPFLCGRVSNVNIPESTISKDTVWIYADSAPALETYDLTIRGIQGLEYAINTFVYISGQADSKLVWKDQSSLVESAIWKEAGHEKDSNRVHTTFNTFGRVPGTSAKVFLNIVIEDTKGSLFSIATDVTEQFDDPGNTTNSILSEIDFILPEPDTSDSASPSVQGWQGHEETIDIN